MSYIDDIICTEIGRLVLDSMNTNNIDFKKLIETKTHNLLSEIHNVLTSYDIEDENADFYAIEKIVCIFEKYGIRCGPCHNF